MTYEQWQAEYARISEDIEKTARACKALQDGGDWANVSLTQQKYYGLIEAQNILQARKPDENGVSVDDRPLSYDEWLSQSDWISHDLDALQIEWNIARNAGDWAGAQGPQEKYHLLRERQAAHNAKKPKE
jgi:hypothetical protein